MVRATAVALVISVLGALGAIAPAAAAARVPKVVLIVGPVGSLTASYRQLADAAGAVAVDAGAQVVKVYSPNATWTAVRQAVDGASVVVYLGHGNGWPSRYRDALYQPTQNGFGLNPVAGVDDVAHQYFGEASVQGLRLAPNAVVLLHHLCYASGNSEPGLAEGTQEQAVQRVDNYAAGFLRAGAAAVVAEAHLGPAYYVAALLRGRATVEATWQAAPSANGHTITFGSARSAGYVARLDPDRAGAGYYRSLVSRGVTAAELRASALGTAGGTIVESVVEPSLAGRGLLFGEPAFASLPVAGTSTRLTLTLASGNAKQIPAKAKAGVRWDPILLEQPSAPVPVPASTPPPTASPAPTATPGSSAAPGASATPGASAAPPPVAPAVDLVVPEQLGAVVEVVPAVRTSRGLRLQVTYPAAPGLYRLVVTLHTPSGTAYDAATQALLVPVIVRVGGPVAVAYGAPTSLAIAVGSAAAVAVRVVNAGSARWDLAVPPAPRRVIGEPDVDTRRPAIPARLVATWVSADGHAVPDPVMVILALAAANPGGATTAVIPVIAPAAPGSYLLLVDVVSPSLGPLSATGSQPAIVRVSVGEAPVATPRPLAGPPAGRG